VGLRICVEDVERRKFLTLSEFEIRPLCRPARSQSLHRLRYSDDPGSYRDNAPSLKTEDVILCCLSRLKTLVIGFQTWLPGFHYGSGHVGFMVYEVELRRVLSEYLSKKFGLPYQF
jgi:hypothetical protein